MIGFNVPDAGGILSAVDGGCGGGGTFIFVRAQAQFSDEFVFESIFQSN